ncbi:hypothetical protein [Aureimonas psammosilenae]|uniref:hypothetical protein n=1 Tax=Aureimonas psammosilenae TaxID=2495496 RepID=UPI001261288B|nr:hypothetical protein [Aureimonas psammosilenae]
MTEYLEEYRGNQFATFANKREAVSHLITIDGLFLRLLEGAVNLRPHIPAFFLLRSHAAYRAAVGAVMGGQVYEAQAMLRLCLEHGSYSLYLGNNAERWSRWMARQDGEAQRKTVKAEFSYGKILRHVTNEAPKLAKILSELYERVIDLGAHPNEQGFSLNSVIREEGGNTHFDTIFLHGDGLALNAGLRLSAQVGLWPLHVGQLIYRERYELLGLREELQKLGARF